jgi:hypothetical protein
MSRRKSLSESKSNSWSKVSRSPSWSMIQGDANSKDYHKMLEETYRACIKKLVSDAEQLVNHIDHMFMEHRMSKIEYTLGELNIRDIARENIYAILLVSEPWNKLTSNNISKLEQSILRLYELLKAKEKLIQKNFLQKMTRKSVFPLDFFKLFLKEFKQSVKCVQRETQKHQQKIFS